MRRSDPPSRLQRQLRRMARLVVRVFYSPVEVHGLEHLPEQGPVLLCANHANAIADAIILIAAFPGLLRPLARSGLFRLPGFRRLLALQGAVPVYRRRHGGAAAAGRNEDVFARCFELLAAGAALLIFPEGQSHSDPHLHPFKTGAARIALGARAANATTPAVIPVGLTFTRKGEFRGGVLVQFGAAVAIPGHASIDSEEDVRTLTARIEQAARDVTINAESWEQLALLKRVERFLAVARGRRASLEERVGTLRRLAELESRLREQEPQVVAELEAKLAEFEDLCAYLGVKDYHLAVSYTPTVVLLFIIRALFMLLLALPVALWGWLNSIVPFLLTRHLAQAFARGRDQYDTAKMALGASLFALFWAAQSAWVYSEHGALGCSLYVISLPIGAFTALAVARERRHVRENLRAFFRLIGARDVRRVLEQRRAELEREFATLGRRLRSGLGRRDSARSEP